MICIGCCRGCEWSVALGALGARGVRGLLSAGASYVRRVGVSRRDSSDIIELVAQYTIAIEEDMTSPSLRNTVSVTLSNPDLLRNANKFWRSVMVSETEHNDGGSEPTGDNWSIVSAI